MEADTERPDTGAARPSSIKVVHGDLAVAFAVVNEQTAWRATTAMTKEPGTVAWIAGFQRGEILVDIGANVGIYSLCAARFRGARVFAFEPESQNYALLNENIYRNALQDEVTAYCLALSDRTRFDLLHLTQFEPGGACHSFGASVDPDLLPRRSAFRQGCFATKLDDLVEQGVIPLPQHVKIDVDGFEHQVVRGAQATFRDPRLKSVLIELNTGLEEHWEVVDSMLEHGFDYDTREADRARRSEGPFKGTGNYVFRR
jgi:FkbM family methyltransferase